MDGHAQEIRPDITLERFAKRPHKGQVKNLDEKQEGSLTKRMMDEEGENSDCFWSDQYRKNPPKQPEWISKAESDYPSLFVF